ncbi:MAG: response regulator [Pseudomonadota bacterium]
MSGLARIMVVDDDDMVASVVSLMLTELGYESEVINSPNVALERFRTAASEFDLVLTDLTMPEMNGVELAKHLKSTRDDIVVAVMTGFGGAAESSTDSDTVDRFLTKPLLLDDLSKALSELLAK